MKYLAIKFLLLFVLPVMAFAQSDPIYHQVIRGESLYSIARKQSVTVKEIMRWNRIPSDQADQLSAGDKLIVGYRGGEPTLGYPSSQAPASTYQPPASSYPPQDNPGSYAQPNPPVTNTRQAPNPVANLPQTELNYGARYSNWLDDSPGSNASGGTFYALIVGISDYLNFQSLRYPDDDAYQIYAYLRSLEGGAIPRDHIEVLVDENATKENIMNTMRDIFGRAGDKDGVLFFFAGHGLEGSLLPHDYDGYSTQISYDEIRNISKRSRAMSKSFIFDACYSGSAIDYVQNLSEEELGMSYEDWEKSKSSGGGILLVSTTTAQQALEDSGLRHGVFSYFLIEGLEGKADINGDRLVTMSEIFNYMDVNVEQYTRGMQKIMMLGSGQDAVVSVLR